MACNLDKTELLFLPGKDSPIHDLTFNFDNSVLTPTETARNLGVTLDSQLSLTANITATTRSCRFMLYNIRRIRPLLTQKAVQVLVQALVISRLDYCNSLLAGLPASAIRPLQLIQNAAARLVFNQPKFSHTTPLLRSLHWLPVAAPHPLQNISTCVPCCEWLRSCLHPRHGQTLHPSPFTPALLPPISSLLLHCEPNTHQNHDCLLSLAPKWWNELPIDIRTSESLHIFRRKLKTHLFRLYLEWKKKKITNNFLKLTNLVALKWHLLMHFVVLLYF